MINGPPMSDKTSFISQIQQAEVDAAETLKAVEVENDRRLQQASEEAELMVEKAEAEQREASSKEINQAKEEAKAVYSRLLTDADNARRDIVEDGKKKVQPAKTHVIDAFKKMFA